ncbi:MAG: glycerol-3-phosphate dehydrogenase/oxidase [Rhodobacteraceae bacterium]|nr:glycerol-3-phosphate dehydrogenase/oxidase [Paracoccaceae bacterium]
MTDTEEVDVLIVGGGINGCGTFRDLSAQKVRTLLLEHGDFCQGASAASSRLMHGGLKYLETGEFGLVRHSAEERNLLLRNAAHYVRPLPCIVPLRTRFGGIAGSARRFLGLKGKIADRGSLITRLGMMMYDAYGRNFRAMPRHRMLGRGGLDKVVAELDTGIIGGAVYYEAQISHAERLGLELVLDGEALCPGNRALNYAVVTGREGEVIRYTHDGRDHAVRAKIIVNAGGAWIDKVNGALGLDSRLMGGSKGSHLVVDNPALHAALNGHMIYFGTPDGRVNLVYPMQDRVLVGSTDIAVDDPDRAACDADEAAYLRNAVAEIFPGIPVTEDQIVFRFCGVRPLPRSDGGDIGLVTRDSAIAELALPGSAVPVLCLIGGKWTTFRSFSEEATDAILVRLKRERRVDTKKMQIGGGRGYPRDEDARRGLVAALSERYGIGEARCRELIARYGTRTGDYLAGLSGSESFLISAPDYSQQEITWIAQAERVRCVDDILRRRTTLSLTGRESPALRDEIADLLPEPRQVESEPQAVVGIV